MAHVLTVVPFCVRVWPDWPYLQAVPQACRYQGKRPRVCVNGTTQAPAPVSHSPSPSAAGAQQHNRGRGASFPPEADDVASSPPVAGAQLHRRGSKAPLPPEADDTTEPARVVGWTHVGDFCRVSITCVGAPCTALVDTSYTRTLMRPDVVHEGHERNPLQ